MTKNNPGGLRSNVIVLAVLYVMTFLSGFLQDTPLNFFNYIFFFLLFIGGIRLLRVTPKSRTSGIGKGFSFLTGVSTIVLGIFAVGYEWARLTGREDLEASFEAILYLVTLVFWIVVIGSLIFARETERSDSTG
jgi:hypothetical protein